MAKPNPTYYNVKTLEVIELQRVIDSMEEALDYDPHQMQIFSDRLPLEQGDQKLVDNWTQAGFPVVTTPIYGYPNKMAMVSTESFFTSIQADLFGYIVTTASNVELAHGMISRIDRYLRFGSYEANLYASFEDYAMEVVGECTPVRDASTPLLEQVCEAAMIFNTDEDSVNCTWEPISNLGVDEWQELLNSLAAYKGMGRYEKTETINRVLQHFSR